MRTLLFVLGLLLLFPLSAAAQYGLGGSTRLVYQDVDPKNADKLSMCATGALKGGGYDAAADEYEWTCGNYNWSALIGGYPVYATATTAGGNSWTMNCTGDGTASNGQAEEQTNCTTDGESIKMYAMADIMLAFDQTAPGGKVYLPAGTYHNAGCGRQADGTANGCPVLRKDYTHEQRRIQMYGGVKLIGAGSQLTDPTEVGRAQNLTWLVADHGAGGDNTTASVDRDGSGFKLVSWSHGSGLARTNRVCKMGVVDINDASSVCELNTATQYNGSVGANIYSRIGTFIGNDSPQYNDQICLNDEIANDGVCSENRLILCTTNGARLSNSTGGCGTAFGTCEPIATAIETDLVAGKEILGFIATGSCDVNGNDCTAQQSTPVTITSVGAACSGTGRRVKFNLSKGSAYHGWPLTVYKFLASSQSFARLYIVDREEFWNEGGGYSDMSFMPGSWLGRDSVSNPADCITGAEAACDYTEILSLNASYKGGYDRVSVWHGNADGGVGNAQSVIDGMTSGFLVHVRDSLIARSDGNTSDASGWVFSGNTWLENTSSIGQPVIYAAYSPLFRMTGDTFIRNAQDSIIAMRSAQFAEFRDITLISNAAASAIFNLRDGGHVSIDGVSGYGNQGTPFQLAAGVDSTRTRDTWSIHVRNVRLTSHAIKTVNTAILRGVIVLTDFDGAANWGGELHDMTFSDISVWDSGTQESCAVFFDGGLGGGGTAEHGLGRTIDDVRNRLSLSNIWFKYDGIGGAGSGYAFCLGNADGDAILEVDRHNRADKRYGDIWDSNSGVPSWTNVSLDDVRVPDNPYASMSAANSPDCNNLAQGTVVRVHDDTADGACTDAGADGQLDGGGTGLSLCKCAAAGTWSAF